MDPSGDCDSSCDAAEMYEAKWKSSVDPSGDCDTFVHGILHVGRLRAVEIVSGPFGGLRQALDPPPSPPRSVWKSSVDPSGDCDTSTCRGSRRASRGNRQWTLRGIATAEVFVYLQRRRVCGGNRQWTLRGIATPLSYARRIFNGCLCGNRQWTLRGIATFRGSSRDPEPVLGGNRQWTLRGIATSGPNKSDTLTQSTWKSSVDPSGDCDILHGKSAIGVIESVEIVSGPFGGLRQQGFAVSRAAEHEWKSSVDPSGDCDPLRAASKAQRYRRSGNRQWTLRGIATSSY